MVGGEDSMRCPQCGSTSLTNITLPNDAIVIYCLHCYNAFDIVPNDEVSELWCEPNYYGIL